MMKAVARSPFDASMSSMMTRDRYRSTSASANGSAPNAFGGK
jgi:hypothetical protein